MLISADKLWKPASEHPADSGFHYCILETPSGCEFRQIVFFSIVHKCWEGLQEDRVKFWLPFFPSPESIPSLESSKFISVPSEVILEEDELGVVVVKLPEGEEGVDVAVLVKSFSQEVMVTLTPAESETATDLGTIYTTFRQAKQDLEKEEKLYAELQD